MSVVYIKNADIDRSKWDACISTADNGLIYGYSFYLDAMSKQWDALVMGDYSIVMPLTWNRKYGIYYLYQPFFMASLGVFGNKLSTEIVHLFLTSIPKRFRYWDIYLNAGNLFKVSQYEFYIRRNFTLDLHKSYSELNANYSSNHIRNIKKAQELQCYIKKNIPITSIIELAQKQSGTFSPVTARDYNNLVKVYDALHAQDKAGTYGVYDKSRALLASCAFFFSHGRAYYILVGNEASGRSKGVSHLLIDSFIKEYAGQKLLLDFEGSNIPSLAHYYKSFGAKEENYPGIKLNRLSAVIKLFKK